MVRLAVADSTASSAAGPREPPKNAQPIPPINMVIAPTDTQFVAGTGEQLSGELRIAVVDSSTITDTTSGVVEPVAETNSIPTGAKTKGLARLSRSAGLHQQTMSKTEVAVKVITVSTI